MFPLGLARILLLSLGVLATMMASIRNMVQKFLPSNWISPAPGRGLHLKWFETMLHRKKLLAEDNQVTKLELCGLDGNRGLAGAMNMLKVEYKNKCALPNSFILKMNRSGAIQRTMLITGGASREAVFLKNELAKEVSHLFPTIYYTSSSKMFGELAIIMEDLRISGGIGLNFVCGNQIWGIPNEKKEYIAKKNWTPVFALEKAFTNAAILHSKYWNDQTLLKTSWLKAADWYNGQNRTGWELAIDRARLSWGQVKQALKDKKIAFNFSEKLFKIIETSYEKVSWDAFQSHIKDPNIPFTLCHGDFHAANMYMRDNGELVMFDWSEVGPWEPTTDLAQMIISDIRSEIFIKNSKTLIQQYYDQLIKLGIDGKKYTFEFCWKRFCHGGAERWIWVFPVLFQFVPGYAFQYFHDQLLAFIENHDEQPYYVLKPVVGVI